VIKHNTKPLPPSELEAASREWEADFEAGIADKWLSAQKNLREKITNQTASVKKARAELHQLSSGLAALERELSEVKSQTPLEYSGTIPAPPSKWEIAKREAKVAARRVALTRIKIIAAPLLQAEGIEGEQVENFYEHLLKTGQISEEEVVAAVAKLATRLAIRATA